MREGKFVPNPMEVLCELAEQLNQEEGASGVQPAPERTQASSHGAKDMEDVVELGVTRAEGSKEPIRSYDDCKSYVGASSEAPLQIGEDLLYYLPNLVPKSDFLQEGAE